MRTRSNPILQSQRLSRKPLQRNCRGAASLVGASAAVILVLTGCSGPVAVPVPSATATAVHRVCASVQSDLPSAVGNLVKRPTEPESDLVAAWGNPPITLRCGVSKPAGLLPTSQLVTVDDVDWFSEQRTAGYLFTTVGRVANIEVAVPDAYKPETDALVDLAAAVKSNDPKTTAATKF